MYVHFGHGRCPLCGTGGDKVEKDTFTCRRCRVAFDRFMLFPAEQDDMGQMWN